MEEKPQQDQLNIPAPHHRERRTTLQLNEHEEKGMGVPVTVIFLAGVSAGIGMLALPYAVALTGNYPNTTL